ncbi:MAG: response regulator, partial [Alphaproteobacteria bacterium]
MPCEEGTQAVSADDLTGAGTTLMVEDEDPVRLFAARALRSKGYRVLEARTGLAALSMLQDAEETVDLIVTDVVMPEMDGPTLIEKVREERPGMRIICISGYAEGSFREKLSSFTNVHPYSPYGCGLYLV